MQVSWKTGLLWSFVHLPQHHLDDLVNDAAAWAQLDLPSQHLQKGGLESIFRTTEVICSFIYKYFFGSGYVIDNSPSMGTYW
jgi:hypothetical protein